MVGWCWVVEEWCERRILLVYVLLAHLKYQVNALMTYIHTKLTCDSALPDQIFCCRC
jgi:hypothetical protein